MKWPKPERAGSMLILAKAVNLDLDYWLTSAGSTAGISANADTDKAVKASAASFFIVVFR